ncbi:MAG: DUF4340 domain-containing protein [Christensenellales bacterium]|jgi:hypothetical protein
MTNTPNDPKDLRPGAPAAPAETGAPAAPADEPTDEELLHPASQQPPERDPFSSLLEEPEDPEMKAKLVQRSRRRRKRNLILLLVALVVITGVTLAIGLLMPGTNSAATPTPTASQTVVLKHEKADIQRIQMTNPEGTYVVVPREDGENFAVQGLEDAAMMDANINLIAAYGVQMLAESMVSETRPSDADLANYGVGPDSCKMEITYVDGEKATFILGGLTPMGSQYYMLYDQTGQLFTVQYAVGQTFILTEDDLRNISVEQVDGAYVESIRIEKNGQVILAAEHNVGNNANMLGVSGYILTEPYIRGVDRDKMQSEIITPLSEVELEQYEGDDPTDPKYGLNEPTLRIQMIDLTGKRFDLYVGADKDEQYAYCRLEGDESNYVYSVKKASLEFVDIDPFYLVEKFSAIPFLANLDRIEAKTSQSAAYATIERVYSPTEVDSQGQPVVESETYLKNGAEEVDKSQINAYYLGLVSPILDGVIPEDKMDQVGDEVLLSIQYTLNKGDERVATVEYLPYDLDHYAARINGNVDFYIRKEKVQRAIDAANDFAAGVAPEVDSGLDDATVIGPSVSTAPES